MPTSLRDLLTAARAAVPAIAPQEAAALAAQGKALIVDVRDGMEVQASGKAKGALHVPRGSLEFKADRRRMIRHSGPTRRSSFIAPPAAARRSPARR
ncbi:MAG: hypothetical protein AB7S71_18800 [Dongiaceae bacterium]